MPASFGGTPDTELPAGTVVMWAGALADIPSGWALCDGNNGTLDFTGRFVRAPSSVNDSPGTTGGQDSKTLGTAQIPGHTHTGVVHEAGDHNHMYGWVTGVDPGDHAKKTDDVYEWNSNADEDHSTKSVGAHKHSVTTDDTGGGNAIDNRPPFYELAFIQKL